MHPATRVTRLYEKGSLVDVKGNGIYIVLMLCTVAIVEGTK